MSTPLESRVAKLEKSSEGPPPIILSEGGMSIEQAREQWAKDHPGQPEPVFVVLPRGAIL